MNCVSAVVAGLCVAALLVMLILLMKHVMAGRGTKPPPLRASPTKPIRAGFMPTDGATPQLRSRMGDVARDLGCVTNLSGQVLAAGPPDLGLSKLSMSVATLQDRVQTAPPTYGNILALYRGLRASRQALVRAAARLEEGEKRGTGGDLVAARFRLAECLRRLARDVRLLGVELKLE